MQIVFRSSLFVVLAMGLVPCVHAQKDQKKYNERAQAIRQEVWEWNTPAFNNRTIPAEYAGESTVILARRAVIEADTKKRFGASRKFYYNSTVRELVKINDKASLEEYSELSYSQFKKLNNWFSGTMTTFIGVRIIKPDGSMREVNVDESVLTKSDRNEQQRKMAISGLQVGDLLDYFLHVEEFSELIKEPERLIFVFGDDHPILDYSIHCEIGDKYAVEYRSMNKAPEAKEGLNDDKDLVLDLDVQHIAAVPTKLWMSSLRQLPGFRLNVLTGGKSISGRAKGEVVKNTPLHDVVQPMVTALQSLDPYRQSEYKKKVIDIMRQYDKHYSRLPKDSLACLAYYAYRFVRYYDQVANLEVGEDRNGTQISTYDYLAFFKFILHHLDIETKYMAASSKYGPEINQVMGPGDMVLLMGTSDSKPLYFNNLDMFTYPGYIPSYVEGQPWSDMSQKAYRTHHEPATIDGKTPLSEAPENIHREDLHVSVDGADMQLLRVKRHTVLTGKMKEDEQLRLLNFEDCYESERAALGVEKSIMDVLKKAKRSKNVSEDYATALNKARASLKDRFKAEIAAEYDQDPKELIAYKVDNMGIRHTAPDLVYYTEFTLDGLMQRAGNNFLLNIGKVFNSPLKLTPSQRTRTVDIYMAYARTLDGTVAFAIPQGFTVQGTDKLNKTLENECGSFTTTAQVKGNQLVVHFKRVYKHGTEQAVKWPQLLAIIDASTDFAGQKVLLKKG